MTTAEIEREFPTNHLFKLGAAMAMGELLLKGFLDAGEAASLSRLMEGFGIGGMEDLGELGLGEGYLADFEELYAAASRRQGRFA